VRKRIEEMRVVSVQSICEGVKSIWAIIGGGPGVRSEKYVWHIYR
jgi:hypothetical protein